jgi:hypothetical protein
VKLKIRKISDNGGFQVEVRGKRAQTFIYCSTLAAFTLVQLFVEILKLSPQKIQRKNLGKKIENLLKYSIFNMESSILINYFTDECVEVALVLCYVVFIV